MSSLLCAVAMVPAVAAVTARSSLFDRVAAVGGEQRRLQASVDKIGCFEGFEEGATLPTSVESFEDEDMSRGLCFNFCLDNNAEFMGLQWGYSCWCADIAVAEELTQGGDGTCDSPCPGDAETSCGGSSAFDMWYITVAEIEGEESGDTPTAESRDEEPVNEDEEDLDPAEGPVDENEEDLDPAEDSASPEDSPRPQDSAPVDEEEEDSSPLIPTGDSAEEEGESEDGGGGGGAGGTCSSDPCENGGDCSVDSSGLHTCACPSGFGGTNCETSTDGLPNFSISVQFQGTFDDSRRAVFQSAANRWAEVLTHIPCTGSTGNGGSAGELVISATLEPIDGPYGTLGFAGPNGIYQDCPGISYGGDMTFDTDDISLMESDGTFEGVILHEMGHVIGVGTLWGSCSNCDGGGGSTWSCPMAAAVYNELAGNPAGSTADIVETNGGQGTACGHFIEDKFDDELMTGFVNSGRMPLSQLTAASLADGGYVVDTTQCDEYSIPGAGVRAARGPDYKTYALGEEWDAVPIEVCAPDGSIVDVIEGKRFRSVAHRGPTAETA